ncbi:hypothetical protein LDENG_00020990 [Lucifuga dentata]|nr:hypothetical protein LDENG_00020990 [Lucifuga dentata]
MRYSYGNTCNFSCEPGYQLVGSRTVTCTSAAEWSEGMPRCEAITCQKPEEEAYLIFQCSHPLTELQPDSTCSFSCEAGYKLQGADSIQCSEHGQWNKDIPTCKELECPAPVIPARVQIRCVTPSFSSPVSTGKLHSQGTVCTFSCDDGHELQGSLSMECTQSGRWTSTPPTCTAVRCPILEAPVNGHINCSDPEFIYNSQCFFTCNHDHLLHGHEVVTCDHHGNWTGEQPICRAALAHLIEPTTIGLATGGAVSLSGLALAYWVLKRMRLRGNKFELISKSDIEDHPQFYKNSTDSLI